MRTNRTKTRKKYGVQTTKAINLTHKEEECDKDKETHNRIEKEIKKKNVRCSKESIKNQDINKKTRKGKEERDGKIGIESNKEEERRSVLRGHSNKSPHSYDCVLACLVIHQAGVTCPRRRPIRTFLRVRGSWPVLLLPHLSYPPE